LAKLTVSLKATDTDYQGDDCIATRAFKFISIFRSPPAALFNRRSHILTPSNRTVQVAVNQTVTIQANYTPIRPVLKFNSPTSLSFTGAIGAAYRVEFSTNLVGWTPLVTQTLSASFVTLTNLGPATNKSRFFRTVLLP
jgi:hypothetical protein